MILHWIFRGTIALLPVLVFLGALIYFDSFKVCLLYTSPSPRD